MRKQIAALLIGILLATTFSGALALDIDYDSLTDMELQEIIRLASAEHRSRQSIHMPVAVNISPDKYTWFVKDYVGRNAAGFGYTSLGGDRLEKYGSGLLEFIFVAEDGMYIDIEDEELLQQYIVTGQNIAPNTEMRYVFEKDSSGNEYSNLIDTQSIRLIDLSVRRIDGTMAGDPVAYEPIPIEPSPDRYTHYFRNYVGKNVAAFGYTSLGGDRRDKYGAGNILINLVADDGSYIDPRDRDALKQYIVLSQNIAPNTELKLTFEKDSRGNEYSNLVDSQSHESITLYVHKHDIVYPEEHIASHQEEQPDETEGSAASPEPAAAPFVADGAVMTYRDVRYRLTSSDTVEICGYTNAESSITIPSQIEGRDVTGIAEGSFEDCTTLKSVLNWADLQYIGAAAFRGCTSLKDISIPGTTTFIGEGAFEGCTSLKDVILWGDPVTLEKNTFKNCSKLTDFSLPSSITCISESAFENCTNMRSVIIWGDITRIEKNAFRNCSSLEDISIPSSCTVIEESAFEGCTDLESVIIWGDTNIGYAAFRGCSSLEDISISSKTEYVADHAFEDCISLERVTLWGNTTSIGKDAFANCPKLINVPY